LQIKVVPEAGFVLKTRTEAGKKVFINICQSDKLAEPANKKKLDDKGEEQEVGTPGLRCVVRRSYCILVPGHQHSSQFGSPV
jgi:hypothetical protein